MLYIIKYISILAFIYLVIMSMFAANRDYNDEYDEYEEEKEFSRITNKVFKVCSVALIISLIGIGLVKNTYYLEPEFVSQSEIVSIQKNNMKVVCEYIDQMTGEKKQKEIKRDSIDLGKYKNNQKDWKITEYIVYTKTDMNQVLFKILTFGHLPDPETCYKIEK